ncbi:MAG: hypothetical protein Q8N74_00705, partial [Sulfuricella sp.]|nr:hypothetical protein [Sulfuricella sp.]
MALTWLRLLAIFALALLWVMPVAAQSSDLWVKPGPDGQPQLQLYFYWTTACPHCQEARSFVEAIPATRPWVALHSLELNGHPEYARQYQTMAAQLGQEAVSVPALLFCGEMHVGWDKAETAGAEIAWRLDECHARLLAGSVVARLSAGKLSVPILGEVDPQHFSLPLMTVAIAGLDAFNPCAF